jgi:hypothetical protein
MRPIVAYFNFVTYAWSNNILGIVPPRYSKGILKISIHWVS